MRKLKDFKQTVGLITIALFFFLREHLSSFLKKLIYFWLCWVFIAALAFSLVVASRGYSAVVVPGLLTVVASLLQRMGSGVSELNNCDFWALEHRLNSCGAWA